MTNKGERSMKKIHSIYAIFIVFFIVIMTSLAILYHYSSSSLKESVTSAVNFQMDYSSMLMSHKIKEIEIEADGILNSDALRNMQLLAADKDRELYDYVTGIITLKDYLSSRQKTNVGMDFFIIYWPRDERIIVGTGNVSEVNRELFTDLQDNHWFIHDKEVYFTRKFVTDWDKWDDEPYLLIKMERDFLYKIRTMLLGNGHEGSLLLTPENESIFSVSGVEREILAEIQSREEQKDAYEVTTSKGKYQILKSGQFKNGLQLVAFYQVEEMMHPVNVITQSAVGLLLLLFAIGLLFMVLYYRNILLQLRIITQNLKQVEEGDFSARITEKPENEFSYVFEQFNRMVEQTERLLAITLKEQQLRHQARLGQLQLQIRPHFLYNCLTYIVTVAAKPKAVEQMATHLARYYRYTTRKESIATIGEEVAYAREYLEIMALRKNIDYEIDVPAELHDVQIIPLIMQPIIENSIEHGIEECEEANRIRLEISRIEDGRIRFEISDDGNGLSAEAREKLEEYLDREMREENESVGLWNVNQRLVNCYDESAKLYFDESIWGGLRVSFTLSPEKIRGNMVGREH